MSAQPVTRAQYVARDSVLCPRGDIWNARKSYKPFPGKAEKESRSKFETYELYEVFTDTQTLIIPCVKVCSKKVH